VEKHIRRADESAQLRKQNRLEDGHEQSIHVTMRLASPITGIRVFSGTCNVLVPSDTTSTQPYGT